MVPSGVWRVVLGLGVPVGFSGSLERMFGRSMPGWGTVYVFCLSGLAELLGFLSLGLVRPWGQVLVRWLPWLGGRRVPPWVAVTVAGLGATAVTVVVWWASLGPWARNMSDPESPHGLAGFVMTACYAPLLGWGPLLAVVTVDYYRRSRR
ncbi:hypothetical protein GCM10009738_38630 [Kitasatospora viridis]